MDATTYLEAKSRLLRPGPSLQRRDRCIGVGDLHEVPEKDSLWSESPGQVGNALSGGLIAQQTLGVWLLRDF